MKKLHFSRLWLILLIPLGIVFTLLAQNIPAFADWYSNTIYRFFSAVIGFVTSLIPFSLGEFVVYGVILWLTWYLIYSIIRFVQQKENRKKILRRFAGTLGVFLSVTYFLFVLFCGINYGRTPYSVHSGLTLRSSTPQELALLCTELMETANTLRSSLAEDDQGTAALADSTSFQTARRARESYGQFVSANAIMEGFVALPKPVAASRGMSSLDITGIYFPFTFEANVNVDVPAYQIPVTMCHELSHLRGFMREDEANFIAYLACRESSYPDFQYSGVMLALTYSMNALYVADYDLFVQVYSSYSEKVLSDQRFNSAYWKQFEGPVAEVSAKVNDTYLKANQQSDGVQSYGRMVDLLLADYRSRHGL